MLTQVPDGDNFVKVAVGGLSACALDTEGKITCWGDQSPNYNYPPSGSAFEGLPTDGGYVDLDVQWRHGCAIKANGATRCWGVDYVGETQPPDEPTPLPDF